VSVRARVRMRKRQVCVKHTFEAGVR
jgi:hypothetical protein